MNNLIINDLKYSVLFANPIGEVRIHESNPFGSTDMDFDDSMGLSNSKNLIIKTSLRYPNPEVDKSLEMDYITEYLTPDSQVIYDAGLNHNKELWVELHFRHYIHIHQFLHNLWQQDPENHPFPPPMTNLNHSFEFVSAWIRGTES
jgi:hypothetical protein